MTRTKPITEADVLKEKFEKIDNQIYYKKTGFNRKVWIRCQSCGRFMKEPVLLQKGQNKIIVHCDYCKDVEGRKILKMELEILPTILKFRKPDL